MRRPVLHYSQILAWADAYYKREGRWPTAESGVVYEQPDEKWINIDRALRIGLRGLRAGNSLPRLLAKHRGHRNRSALPELSVKQVLRWCDSHYKRWGTWPTNKSGPIVDAPGETWMAVDMALRKNLRGFPGGSSLAQLLYRHREVRTNISQPRLTVRQILEWIDSHHAKTGQWPTASSGEIPQSGGETWAMVDGALNKKGRGLRVRSSLSKLLAKYRGVSRHVRMPRLTLKQVLTWADAYQRRHGHWPDAHSGNIPNSDGDTWGKIQNALKAGRRGLPQTDSLAKLFVKHRHARIIHNLPPLTEEEVLRWGDEYQQKHGCLPTRASGPIAGVPGETWSSVNFALTKGHRGLPDKSSLAKLFAKHRGRRNKGNLPPLTLKTICKWAEHHIRLNATHPRVLSGPVPGAEGETWQRIDDALRQGYRGLPGGSSLYQLLKRRGLLVE